MTDAVPMDMDGGGKRRRKGGKKKRAAGSGAAKGKKKVLKVRVGPKGGKYYIKGGKKVYL